MLKYNLYYSIQSWNSNNESRNIDLSSSISHQHKLDCNRIAWEQRKLGDIGKARSGVGFPDADQGGVTGVPFFKVSDMNLDGNENEMTGANNYFTAEQQF